MTLRAAFAEAFGTFVLVLFGTPTRGTDYPLAPGPKTPAPLVRTAHIEADGKPLPDPDPGNENAFAWMPVTRFDADRNVPYPFDLATLLSGL